MESASFQGLETEFSLFFSWVIHKQRESPMGIPASGVSEAVPAKVAAEGRRERAQPSRRRGLKKIGRKNRWRN